MFSVDKTHKNSLGTHTLAPSHAAPPDSRARLVSIPHVVALYNAVLYLLPDPFVLTHHYPDTSKGAATRQLQGVSWLTVHGSLRNFYTLHKHYCVVS